MQKFDICMMLSHLYNNYYYDKNLVLDDIIFDSKAIKIELGNVEF